MKYFFVTFFVFASFGLSRTFTFCQSQPPSITDKEPIPLVAPASMEEGETTDTEKEPTLEIPMINPAIYQGEPVSSQRLAFANEALKYLGTPYKYASTNSSGMDCSGLVYRAALDALDTKLPRSTQTLANHCTRLSAGETPRVGDLLFFNTSGSGISHVGIYLGDQNFVHAASSGPRIGVIISSMTESYYINCFLFYASFLD